MPSVSWVDASSSFERTHISLTPSNSSDSLIYESKNIMKRRKWIKSPSSGRRTPRSRPVMVVRYDGGDLGGPAAAHDRSESDSTDSRWDEFASDPEAQSCPLIKPKRFNDSECRDRPRSRPVIRKAAPDLSLSAPAVQLQRKHLAALVKRSRWDALDSDSSSPSAALIMPRRKQEQQPSHGDQPPSSSLASDSVFLGDGQIG
ncbi:hypothetical protein IV203_020576 [Nitzschia inconspicua]|uniref:Uncharacterized protein n=1 Tax=Nitzschia inconspicua TaxID=303405 RepID=A0A9K3KFE1_9STRA|nr:hypothetical protein IV203_020576 [Nitzschia inconspicua]